MPFTIRYIRAGQMKIKYNDVIALFTNLCRDGPAVKALRIMHLIDPAVYIIFLEDIFLMIHDAEMIVNSDQKPSRLSKIAHQTYASALLQ